MSEQSGKVDPQRDKNLAADTRPVPSQAEGDRETIDQDLADKEGKGSRPQDKSKQ